MKNSRRKRTVSSSVAAARPEDRLPKKRFTDNFHVIAQIERSSMGAVSIRIRIFVSERRLDRLMVSKETKALGRDTFESLVTCHLLTLWLRDKCSAIQIMKINKCKQRENVAGSMTKAAQQQYKKNIHNKSNYI